ncbi:MAG: acylneuraminate cytidylyltransferase family protein [Planctomycetaceae bacterium]
MGGQVLTVIPARGGSKGLPRKNVLSLGDKPLVAWTIEASLACPLVDVTIVSTDDADIAATAQRHGAEVPFLRPAELASDSASSEAVLKHALVQMEAERGRTFPIVVYLQPTEPFRAPGIIAQVVRALLDDESLDSAFAAKPEHKNYWSIEGDGHAVPLGRRDYRPRQSKPPVFREDTGVALATRREVVLAGDRIGRNVRIVPHEHAGDFIDIHDESDLWLAEQLIAHRKAIPNT